MQRMRPVTTISKWIAAAGCVAAITWTAAPAGADGVMQLTAPSAKYTLGRFLYEAPQMDGWRQLANDQATLTLVYAEQKDPGSIETKFGVTFEAHDIPDNVAVESAAALAELSRKQMVVARKDDLVGQSTIEAVPSIDNVYTYRLLVHSPKKDDPDAYEVYYVATSPDRKQYLVIQCITKTPEYANELYFTEFYGSLSSLKYPLATGDAKTAAAPKPDAAPKAEASSKAQATPKTNAAPKADAAPKAGTADAAKPAGH